MTISEMPGNACCFCRIVADNIQNVFGSRAHDNGFARLKNKSVAVLDAGGLGEIE